MKSAIVEDQVWGRKEDGEKGRGGDRELPFSLSPFPPFSLSPLLPVLKQDAPQSSIMAGPED